MSDSDRASYYATLGLPRDATFDQVKSRFRQLNDAYLKILELSRNTNSVRASPPANTNAVQQKVQPKPQSSPQDGTNTEPIATLKERLKAGKINATQFEKLAEVRYEYLKNKPFIELSDSELDERLKGFEGVKLDPKYWKSKK